MKDSVKTKIKVWVSMPTGIDKDLIRPDDSMIWTFAGTNIKNAFTAFFKDRYKNSGSLYDIIWVDSKIVRIVGPISIEREVLRK